MKAQIFMATKTKTKKVTKRGLAEDQFQVSIPRFKFAINEQSIIAITFDYQRMLEDGWAMKSGSLEASKRSRNHLLTVRNKSTYYASGVRFFATNDKEEKDKKQVFPVFTYFTTDDTDYTTNDMLKYYHLVLVTTGKDGTQDYTPIKKKDLKKHKNDILSHNSAFNLTSERLEEIINSVLDSSIS